MAKEHLGDIDCPVCGYTKGMRITADKNGEPFGFCEQNCDAQLRIGGKRHRVEKFFRLHPDIKRTGESPPAQPASAAPVAPPKVDATAATPAKPETKPAKKKAVCLLDES